MKWNLNWPDFALDSVLLNELSDRNSSSGRLNDHCLFNLASSSSSYYKDWYFSSVVPVWSFLIWTTRLMMTTTRKKVRLPSVILISCVIPSDPSTRKTVRLHIVLYLQMFDNLQSERGNLYFYTCFPHHHMAPYCL